jgi:AcrR family transcriptional regulator
LGASAPKGVTKKKRARHDLRRERNRHRLIDATIALVLEQGSGGLSMVSITKRAALHHPAFYSHFRNVEECLEAAFTHVSNAQHERTATLRDSMWDSGRPDFATEVAVTENALKTVLEYRQLYLIVLQCRHEQSRIGELAREEFERTAQEITEYVWRAALYFRVEAQHLREFEKLARYILEGIAAAALDVLHGRAKDVHVLAERLTRYHWVLVTAERERMGVTQLARAPKKRPTQRTPRSR